MTISAPPSGGYDCVSAEYYDTTAHPTCANLREASLKLLNAHSGDLRRYKVVAEIGSGRSLLAERELVDASRLLLFDSSPGMLNYSRPWSYCGAQLVVADAEHLPLATASIPAFVAVLGDPYNTPGFWREICRALMPGGLSLFTTPSHDWASGFRKLGDTVLAQFDSANGRTHFLPSWIYSSNDQVGLMQSAGLRVDRVADLRLSAIQGSPISAKLRSRKTTDPVIATLYAAHRISVAGECLGGAWNQREPSRAALRDALR